MWMFQTAQEPHICSRDNNIHDLAKVDSSDRDSRGSRIYSSQKIDHLSIFTGAAILS
jgi:hypothetical protein